MSDVSTNTRRYARRILGIHLLLLAVVLAAVALAARQIYADAYKEVVVQAEDRQRTLAVQTARGIENHYGSILTDLDLLRRADSTDAGGAGSGTSSAEPAKGATATPRAVTAAVAAEQMFMPAGVSRLLQRFVSNPGAAQLVGGILWRQLDGRAAMLFTCSRAAVADAAAGKPVEATSRPAADRGGAERVGTGRAGGDGSPAEREESEFGRPPGGFDGGPDGAEPPPDQGAGRPRRPTSREAGRWDGGGWRLDDVGPSGSSGSSGSSGLTTGAGRRGTTSAGTSVPRTGAAARGTAAERAAATARAANGGWRQPAEPRARGGGPREPPGVAPIGSAEVGLDPAAVLRQGGAWLRDQKGPSVSQFERLPVGDGKAIRANLVCVPLEQDRMLVAVVPLLRVETDFLKPLAVEGLRPRAGQTLSTTATAADAPTTAWLVDQQGTVMAASRPDLVDTSVTSVADPKLAGLARRAMSEHGAGSDLIDHPFAVGKVAFDASAVAAEPVTVGDRHWELFVTTPLTAVDGTVNALFHRALLWAVFVVCSVTAILVSTATQMIRNRTRAERLQHELLTRELAQARQIQLAWLPAKPPPTPGIDVAAVNSPASHISGDFYNWFELPDGRLVVAVGDVTGHGMAAAFLMSTTQLLVRNTMALLGDPGRCLDEVNRQLCVQVFNGQFVTLLVTVIDRAACKLHLATAGHPAPLVTAGDGFAPLPVEPQLVLGVDADVRYVTETHDLPRGGGVLLFTDGVVECPDAGDRRFGDGRLRDSLHGTHPTAQSMLDRVVAAVNGFRGARDLDDDLTLVAVQTDCGR